MTRAVWAAFRLQLQIIRRVPDYLLPAVVAPIMGIVFLLVIRGAGREDLAAYAVVGPVLIGLWHASLNIAGEVITGDRGNGVLEALVATPTPMPALVLGRVLASTSLGLVASVEMTVIAVVLFRVQIDIAHPALLAATLIVTALATSGHAVLMAATFVLGQSSRPFQRALTFPFYVLGGVVVPVALLPAWTHAPAKVIFLSWASDLMRSSLVPGPVDNPIGRLGMVAFLGAVALAGGWALTLAMLRRSRSLGSMTYA